MRRSLAVALALVALLGSRITARADEPSAGRQLHISLRLFEGDPLGSLQAGTLKVLAEPSLVVGEGRPFSFVSGGELPIPDGAGGVEFVRIGRAIEGKAGLVEGDKVRLDLTLSDTTAAGSGEGAVQLRTESTRTIAAVKAGEVVKVRCGKRSADKQMWAELSVELMKP